MASGSSIATVRGLGSANKAVVHTGTGTFNEPKGVYIGVSDDYKFTMNGVAVTFKNCNAGSFLPIRPTKATNTSDATVDSGDIILLY